MKKKICFILAIGLVFGAMASANAVKPSITLVVWDTFTSEAMRDGIEKINEMFMDEYPNVKIERVAKDLDSMAQTLKPAFMSGDAPDVIYHEMGIGEMGDYVKAGYLMDLSKAYDEFNWHETLMSVASSVPSVGDIIFGVGNEVETMSLYYNPTILEQLDLEVPRTVEELTAAMAIVKKAGYIPMGNTLDQYWHTNMNFVGTILYAFMSKSEILACMNEDASWDLPSVRNGVDTILHWYENGFFPDHPEVNAEQQIMFALGESVFWITGNWSIGMLSRIADESFRYDMVPFPPSETCKDGGSQVNFVGSGFMASNLSSNKEYALKYIDFCMNRTDTARVWHEIAQIIPPLKADSGAIISENLDKVIGFLADPEINNISGINMWLGGNTFEFFSHAGQNLIVGAYNTESFIGALEEALEADKSAGNTKSTFKMD